MIDKVLFVVGLFSVVVQFNEGVSPPYECRHATNLTDYWRKDNVGKNIKPGGTHSSGGYACDKHMDIHWFRFTQEAGRKMRDTCPKPHSCGTFIPIWTDAPMPKVVGQKELVKAFQSYPFGGCKKVTNLILVMRCSTNADDFIYKNEVSYSDPCSYAFCGM